MFIWLFALIPLIYLLARPAGSPGCGDPVPASPPPPIAPICDDPLAIARKRLAIGEIPPAEFEEIRGRVGA
jgi:hypothetical protein